MNKVSRLPGLGVVLSLLLVLAVGQARALHVLTFDTQNAGRNDVTGGLGFSLTQVGSDAAADLDLSLFDVIYLSQPYDEFLQWSLGLGSVDLKDFISNGGGLVFGSNGDILPILPLPPLVEELTQSRPDQTLQVAAVPEPGAFALFGLGMAGLFLLRRRMLKKA